MTVKWKETPTKTHKVGAEALKAIKQNLANLSQADKDEMQMHKQICLARHNCKGLSSADIKRHIATLPEDVQSRIKELREERK